MAKKKIEVDLGKGFKRIYIVISLFWSASWVWILFTPTGGIPTSHHAIASIFWIIVPIPVYYILLWFINGFKNK